MSSTQTGLEIRSGGLLGQGAGYGIVLGLGAAFTLIILAAVRIQKLYLQEDSDTSEMFMVANRSVGPGLTCSAVFSSWMWINETVFACVQGYNYGVSTPMWWATGLAYQIALMAVVGIYSKLSVPHAHTSLEIIQRRYGAAGHFLFTVLILINNVLGCSGLIITGSQLVTGMTGMHLAAATVLLPFGVVLYTAVGGLKATFLTDFIHTTIAIILIIYFTLTVLTHEAIGGLSGLYDKVLAVEAAGEYYIEGNYLGSTLTMKSYQGIIFAQIVRMGNLALVVMDTAFWQKSFASEVHAVVPGYDLAAIAIFGVPWGIGTVIGLACRAIQNTPIFPTYPGQFTTNKVRAGLVMPYTVQALIGHSGVIGILVLLFMAITSTVSSSMIGVSSILSFDLYRTYLNPKATDRQVVRASHLGVIFYACLIVGVSMALNYGGANLTWINYCLPVLTCPGVFPLLFTVSWSGQTKLAAILSPILGMASGIGIWLGTSYYFYGEVNLTTTLNSTSAVSGSATSLLSPIIYSVIISYARPATFDWREFLKIDLVEDHESGEESTVTTEGTTTPVLTSPGSGAEKTDEKLGQLPVINVRRPRKQSLDDVEHPLDAATQANLRKWLKIAWGFLIFVVLVTWVVWPMPLYRDYIFTKSFFSGWVSVAIFWQFLALILVVIYPIYDGRNDVIKSARGVWNSFRQRSRRA